MPSFLIIRVYLMISWYCCVQNHRFTLFFLEWTVHGPNARTTFSTSEHWIFLQKLMIKGSLTINTYVDVVKSMLQPRNASFLVNYASMQACAYWDAENSRNQEVEAPETISFGCWTRTYLSVQKKSGWNINFLNFGRKKLFGLGGKCFGKKSRAHLG